MQRTELFSTRFVSDSAFCFGSLSFGKVSGFGPLEMSGVAFDRFRLRQRFLLDRRAPLQRTPLFACGSFEIFCRNSVGLGAYLEELLFKRIAFLEERCTTVA